MTGRMHEGAEMSEITDVFARTTAAFAAAAALGTPAFGLVDVTKAFGGGVSNCGFGHVRRALEPFAAALTSTRSDWMITWRGQR
jgi:hypothetical protein